MAKSSSTVLAICGSPRVEGNTELLADACLEGVREGGSSGEKIRLNELHLSPCQECGGCQQTGRCVIRDDMQKLYPRLRQAGGIILASPIFFGSITAQTKIVIDRSQCFWAAKYLLKKPLFPVEAKVPGLFLCAGGMDRYRFFQNAQQIVKIWFTILNVHYVSELFFPGIDQKGEILQHPAALRKAHQVGRYLAHLSQERE
jgi:multimeric flavodoxin WrbA